MSKLPALLACSLCGVPLACFQDKGAGEASDTTGTATTGASTTTATPTTTAASTGTTAETTGEPTTGAGTTGPLAPCMPGKLELGVDRLLFGDTDPDGLPIEEGWRLYGLDIDGRTSTADAKDLCIPLADAQPDTPYPDGEDGRDNSFGKNIVPLFTALGTDFSADINARITAGEFTYLLQLDGLEGAPACATTGALVVGAPLGAPPKWDGGDMWPIDPGSLAEPDKPDAALCTYGETERVGDHVLTGPPCQFNLYLGASGTVRAVPLRHARLAFDLAPDGKSAVGGHISGILQTEEFVAYLQAAAASFDPGFCDPNNPTVQSLLQQVRQASDILIDGTQDPRRPCSGISVGLGFTMQPVQIGIVADPIPPPTEPCPP